MTNPRTVPEVLRAAADLIEPEGAWTQHHYARDANGKPVGPTTDRAVCWCAEGAIKHVAARTNVGDLALSYAARRAGLSLHWWNDMASQTQERVVAGLRDAAEEFQQ